MSIAVMVLAASVGVADPLVETFPRVWSSEDFSESGLERIVSSRTRAVEAFLGGRLRKLMKEFGSVRHLPIEVRQLIGH